MIKIIIFSFASAILAIAPFIAARHFGLCMCDDYLYVNLYPEVMNGLSISGLSFALTHYSESIWMPLSYLSYMLDHSLGWGCYGMHIQNMIWHAGATVLLFLLLNKLFKCPLASLVATLIWSVHPLRVESVVWIASRKDVISAFFLLAALLAWLKVRRESPKSLFLSFSLLVIGAMAKPSVMVFPAFALSIDFLITHERKELRTYWNLIIFCIAIAIEAAWFQRAGGASNIPDLIPLGYKLLNALASLSVYVGNALHPDALAMQCFIRYPDPPRFSILGGLVLLIILTGCAGVFIPRIRRAIAAQDWEQILLGNPTANAVLAGLFIFFSCLFPFLGVAGFGMHAFADRFTILPSLGLSIALCAILTQSRHRLIAFTVSLIAVLVLFWKAVQQTDYWRDDETMLLHTLAVDRDENINAHLGLGMYYWEYEHDMDKVYTHIKKALDNSWCERLKEMTLRGGHFLIEACYAKGLRNEAEDYYFLMRRSDAKNRGPNNKSMEMCLADALYELHTKNENKISEARKILADLEERDSGGYITAHVDYLIAQETGNTNDIKRALSRCASVRNSGLYFNGKWAQKLLTNQ